ncbi:helix-turn-helix domain-containing protein [Peptostreptococcus equinus]|uniref:Helix-turn-helix transcriptional regulator n=1 Tax=Peptostreptococcus equinus TaxID=3003601 RepID=A0ABY7JN20_9FIRM|nr:helix-turn-helix transcriptional regulator [Peptostreptococcus sp. CBA3647]WAW14771.1 helix-turn-helix transcriptional regulator [Peptostreptococcus sp. CBA3647]
MSKINLDFIKEKRKEKNLTLQIMADKLGYKKASTYSNYENGIYTIKADMLPVLANIFGCEIQDFFS